MPEDDSAGVAEANEEDGSAKEDEAAGSAEEDKVAGAFDEDEAAGAGAEEEELPALLASLSCRVGRGGCSPNFAKCAALYSPCRAAIAKTSR